MTVAAQLKNKNSGIARIITVAKDRTYCWRASPLSPLWRYLDRLDALFLRILSRSAEIRPMRFDILDGDSIALFRNVSAIKPRYYLLAKAWMAITSGLYTASVRHVHRIFMAVC